MNSKAAIVGGLAIISGSAMAVNARRIASQGWAGYKRKGNKELAPIAFMTWGMLPSERAWRIFLRVAGTTVVILGILILWAAFVLP
ncbi:MAG TPA: hypothetical protein VF660_10725 [Actinomycetota bacterium]|jgi:hypothetical protein